MKTNISNLMSTITLEERKLSNMLSSMRAHIYNITITELDGRENIIEDNKEEFDREMNEHLKLVEKISLFKAVLYEKNNSFKLSDGRSIQQAIVDNTNLRNVKSYYEEMLEYHSSKKRYTEVNNSYFECKTLNFDIKTLREKLEDLEEKIQKTDFEISKLNSIEFEITI